MILCIETATSLCSVALCNSNGVIAVIESGEDRSHTASLTPGILELLKKTGIKITDLEAVAVSKGPGSYTGLRIGVSTAKGMAYAASIPMIGISTTYSMFHGFISSGKDFRETDLFCPLLDARRMEAYYSVFSIDGTVIKDTRAEIITEESFSDLPDASRIFFFGDGSAKCMNIISRKNKFFDTEFRISASSMQKPAYESLSERRFENTAYFEPFYLKDFLATKPVKNIL
ncbi:MAG: tRNA (adenosine(37)-N6)-threonylcarbamoyltransferase complex dimerization subunit type 1 TsaB [Bacteroidota bacterium]